MGCVSSTTHQTGKKQNDKKNCNGQKQKDMATKGQS